VNTCYKHFYYFVSEFGLVDKKELEPLVCIQFSAFYTMSGEKVNHQTMCDRNVKSERILTKLCALNYRYICERTTKFC